MLTGSIIFGSIFLVGSIVSFLYLKKAYREYDHRETLKESIIDYRAKIKMAQDYFRRTYDHNVYNNIKTNLDFCLKIIYNKSLEDQVKGLKNLYDTLYETDYRLKTAYVNVDFILAPMKNLREKLFEEQMDYIRENSEGLI